MTAEDIEKIVIQAYKKIYPKWKSVRVTQTVPDVFDGTLAVVAYTDEDAHEDDEMCFVFDNGKVQIFQSTEQLAIFLASRVSIPWYQRVFATSILAGIAFLISIVML